MKQFNYVYKITNLINGKIYIGKHSTDNLDDNYMGSGTRLHQAYKKYGLENFEKEIIDYYSSEEELNRGEMFYIEKFNSTDPNIGYNLTYGGDGVIPTKETIQKISKTLTGRHLNEEHRKHMCKSRTEEHRRKIGEFWKGKKRKPRSEEHCRKLGEAAKGRIPWNKGKKGVQCMTEETRQKISQSMKGKKLKSFSEETKKKMSESAKLAWQRRKRKESQI